MAKSVKRNFVRHFDLMSKKSVKEDLESFFGLADDVYYEVTVVAKHKIKRDKDGNAILPEGLK